MEGNSEYELHPDEDVPKHDKHTESLPAKLVKIDAAVDHRQSAPRGSLWKGAKALKNAARNFQDNVKQGVETTIAKMEHGVEDAVSKVVSDTLMDDAKKSANRLRHKYGRSDSEGHKSGILQKKAVSSKSRTGDQKLMQVKVEFTKRWAQRAHLWHQKNACNPVWARPRISA